MKNHILLLLLIFGTHSFSYATNGGLVQLLTTSKYLFGPDVNWPTQVLLGEALRYREYSSAHSMLQILHSKNTEMLTLGTNKTQFRSLNFGQKYPLIMDLINEPGFMGRSYFIQNAIPLSVVISEEGMRRESFIYFNIVKEETLEDHNNDLLYNGEYLVELKTFIIVKHNDLEGLNSYVNALEQNLGSIYINSFVKNDIAMKPTDYSKLDIYRTSPVAVSERGYHTVQRLESTINLGVIANSMYNPYLLDELIFNFLKEFYRVIE